MKSYKSQLSEDGGKIRPTNLLRDILKEVYINEDV